MIVCGRLCLVKYAIVIKQINQKPIIRFPDTHQEATDQINKLRPNTVTVIPLSQLLDLPNDEDGDEERETMMDLGLDPYDPGYSELAPHGMNGDEDFDEDNISLISIKVTWIIMTMCKVLEAVRRGGLSGG